MIFDTRGSNVIKLKQFVNLLKVFKPCYLENKIFLAQSRKILKNNIFDRTATHGGKNLSRNFNLGLEMGVAVCANIKSGSR